MAVDSRESLRARFNESVGYGNVTRRDLEVLKLALDHEFQLANAEARTRVGRTLAVDWDNCTESYDEDGRLRSAFVKCKANYFEDREAVSFNGDGFVGFCGWADGDNTQIVLDAFQSWLDDYMLDGKIVCARRP